jgi:hypothetical protein
MPVIFGSNESSPRGCFVAFTYNGDSSKGALLTLPPGNLITKEDPTWPLIVTSVRTEFKENTQFLKCFNDRIYTYTFGGDVGLMTVNFMGFIEPGVGNVLGNANANVNAAGGAAGAKDPWEIMIDGYNKARVSKSLDFAILTVGKKSIQGIVRYRIVRSIYHQTLDLWIYRCIFKGLDKLL